MTKEKIKVFVVEDSNVVRIFLVHLINSDPQLEVVGTAGNGQEALEFLSKESTDIVLMDIDMPVMDGFETTRRIMESNPVPIVICTGSTNSAETVTTFRLMEAGAVACVAKPLGKEHQDFEAVAAHLLQTLRLMSEVKVVRRWPGRSRREAAGSIKPSRLRSTSSINLVGIGASTGGPPVLQTILSSLPKNFPVPILIVQHIAPGFLSGLVEWLNQTTGFSVHVAGYGMEALPGHVYLAPDDCHMIVRSNGRIILTKEETENGLRPSVAHLFRSLADVYGDRAAGVLLTGMGKDGAVELKQMRDANALTIAQDRESSVVHGMPGEAIALGAAMHILPPSQIASLLVTAVNDPLRMEGRRA